MPEKRYILTATDMSAWAKHAENKGAALTKLVGNAEMLLVNVQEQVEGLFMMASADEFLAQQSYRREAEKILQETASRLSEKEGITVTPIVCTGSVSEEIKALVKEKNASLLVIGAHGQGYHFMPIIGNIPAKLIQGGQCPTLIIRQEEMRPYKKVLIPVDFSEVSLNQVKQSLPFLPEDAEIILMSVCGSSGSDSKFYASVKPEILEEYRNKVKGEANEKINALIQRIDSQRKFQTHVALGIPHKLILDYVKNNGIDLLVLGKHPRIRLEDYLVGSTVHYAINSAECDVMITTPA